MEHSRTVVDAKLVFLRQQIRLLSTQLEPSAQWRDDAPYSDQPDLTDKAVEEAVSKLNAKLKQHNRLVYSTESTRHVAEQIDVLYWNAVSNSGDGVELDTDLTFPLDKTADLTNQDVILALPEILADPSVVTESQKEISLDDQKAYEASRSRLANACEYQKSTQTRLEQLRALQNLLVPYQTPQESIQPNLVTRNGELGEELDRMRILLARVTGAVQQQKERNIGHGSRAAGDIDDQKANLVTDREKLDTVMHMT